MTQCIESPCTNVENVYYLLRIIHRYKKILVNNFPLLHCYKRLKNHIGHYHSEHPVHIVSISIIIFPLNLPNKRSKN